MADEMKKLLLYNVPAGTEEGRRFREIGRQQGSVLREVAPTELDRTLADLYAETEPKEPEYAVTEMSGQEPAGRGYCVICGFDKPGFEALLRQWHEEKVAGLALKAVATAHNQAWKLGDLFVELEREDRVTKAYVALRRQVHRLEQGLEKKGLAAEPEALRGLFSEASVQSLADARQMLTDIRAINEDTEILEVHARLNQAWNLG